MAQDNKLVGARMGEIMLALRARYFEHQREGKDTDTGVPLDEFGADPVTRAALKSWREAKYVEVVGGMVRFGAGGFGEAFRIEEKQNAPKAAATNYADVPLPGMGGFTKKAGR